MSTAIAVSSTVLGTTNISADAPLVDMWLHGRSIHTQRAYRSDVARFQAAVRKPLAWMTLRDLQAFANDALGGLAPGSRYRTLSAVKSLFAFGHRLGYLPFDVGGALRLPAVRDKLAERILPESDVHRMLVMEPDDRNRAILTLLYASGVRVGELCGLRGRDLQAHGDGGQITVLGKGAKTRSIQIPSGVWKLLLPFRGDGDAPVFLSRKGRRGITSVGVWLVVRQAARRAGIEALVSPHWFRHAHASHALDRGAPIHLVAETLGHGSIKTTGRYAHARPNDSSSRFLPL